MSRSFDMSEWVSEREPTRDPPFVRVIDDTELFNTKLQEWEDFYNFGRPHGGLNGQTPYERLRQKTTTPA